MSIIRNLLAAFVPVRERRESIGSLATLNAEVVHDCNGCEAASVYVNAGAGTWNSSLEFSASIDGTNFFSVLAWPLSNACSGGTIPSAGQPIVLEAINTTSVIRTYVIGCGQFKKIRVRASAWVAGSADVTIISEAAASSNPYVMNQRANTLTVTATGVAGAAVTATLPAVAGLRHYIDRVDIVRSATAALTAALAPVVVTSTNIPGALAFTFGADTGGIGVDKMQSLDAGSSGLACTAAGVATTIVCPVYTGVIWRVNVTYRLGL
jgi:hypothetical protein